MKQADIRWQDGDPVSLLFDDIYYSKAGGLAESEHVFLSGNDFRERISKSASFTVGEIGFGTGLNFLLSWQAWKELSPPRAYLNFISTELYPLSHSDLQRALERWPLLERYAQKLLERWPLPVSGQHLIEFDEGAVRLLLHFGDARRSLGSLTASVDCWYLDGFAPQKNPELWERSLLEDISRLSAEGSTLSTYACTGDLKRTLTALGWKVEKFKGFGTKRDSIRASFVSPTRSNKEVAAPWFRTGRKGCPVGSRIAVIGGGIAGCTLANELSGRGYEVTLFEKEAALAQHASGNRLGLVIPYLSLDDNVRHRFYANAFSYATSLFNSLATKLPSWRGDGVSHRFEEERFQALSRSFNERSVPHELVQENESKQFWYPKAGSIDPRALCEVLSQSNANRIAVHYGSEVTKLGRNGDYWSVEIGGVPFPGAFECVVVADSYFSALLSPLEWMPFTVMRGEIVEIEDPHANLAQPLCGKKYIIPLGNQRFLLGASYNQVFMDPTPSKEIQLRLLTEAREEFEVFSDQATIRSSRVGFRAATYDRMPYCGPVPDRSAFIHMFADYRKGKDWGAYSSAPLHEGLFVSVGHGSRGLVSAPYCGAIVTAMIAGDPLPAEQEILDALSPSRWLLKNLKQHRS